jgi:hypothetical protein
MKALSEYDVNRNSLFMTKYCTVLCLFFLASSSANAQGLNNKNAVDETDIKNCLKLLGMEIYKFPVLVNEDSVYLNYIVEEYEDTTLTERSDNLDDIKKLPEKYWPSAMAALKTGHDTSLIRMVMYDKPREPFEIQFSYNNYSAVIDSKFDKERFGMIQTRGFSYSIPKIGERAPLLAIYAHRKGEKVIHCPGNLMPEKIKKMYAYTCFVYVELVKLK